MWPFKKKIVEEPKTVEELYRDVKAVDVFEGVENPWRIYVDSTEEYPYSIEVFSLKKSDWLSLRLVVKDIIGVKYDEYIRIMKELFGAHIIGSEAYFKTKEEAQKAIDEFSPYYDSYHVPRAIIDRLTCYDEDGYPPYFLKYQKEQGPPYNSK